MGTFSRNIFQKIKDNYYLQILIIYIVWKISLLIISYMGTLYFPIEHFSAPDKHMFPSIWAWWDGGIIHDIAVSGYNDQSNINNPIRTAFFPLYPFLVRFLSIYILKDIFLSQFIVSSLAMYGALIYLYKLVRIDYSKEIALKSVFFTLIFPFSLFFNAGYTESLFLFLLIASYYYFRKESYLPAGIFGFFSSLTRFFGIFLFIVFIYEYLRKINFNIRKIKLNILNFLLIPLGTFTFFLYLQYKFNDFFKTIKVENSFSREINFNVIEVIHKAIDNILSKGIFNRDFILPFFEFTMPLLFLILSIYIFLKINKGYGLLGILFLLPTFLGNQFMSGNRLVIVIFPIYILFAIYSEKNKIFELALAIISISLLSIFSLAYTHQNIFIG